MTNIGKEVIIFNYREFYGFIPKNKGKIIAETENCVLVSTGLFTTDFVMKNKKDASCRICGYIEYTIKE